MAATLAALTPFQTPVDDAWLQVEKKDGRRSSFTILGVASFANGDLSCASQNVAVIFKVCSASRVNHLPRFCFVFVFHVVHEATQTSRAFFYFMFHNFHPQNLFKQAACFQTVKATIGAFFYFLNFLQNKTQLYRHNRSPFLFFIYISAPFYVLVFLFFPRACEWDMSKRCSESRTSIFDFVYPNLVLSECSSASYFYKHCNSL